MDSQPTQYHLKNIRVFPIHTYFVFLIFYLVTLLIGSYSSLVYTINTNQKLFTAWAPYVWPIKTIMSFGILLMLLQSFSMFFKDLAKVRGIKI